MCAFYTPIFERGWVKEMLEKIAKEKQEIEIRYEPIKDDNEIDSG